MEVHLLPVSEVGTLCRHTLTKMSELPDDLLVIIALYSTEYGTFALLSISPHQAYRSTTWRAKTQVETRGLMVRDYLVQQPMWWARYYRIINRTHYGELRTISSNSFDGKVGSIDSTPTGQRIVLIAHSAGESAYIAQLSDLDLVIHDCIDNFELIIPFTRATRMISTRRSSRGPYHSRLIDERGNYYEFNGREISRFIGGNVWGPIVSMARQAEPNLILTRDGTIFVVETCQSLQVGRTPIESEVVQLMRSGILDATGISYDIQAPVDGILPVTVLQIPPCVSLFVDLEYEVYTLVDSSASILESVPGIYGKLVRRNFSEWYYGIIGIDRVLRIVGYTRPDNYLDTWIVKSPPVQQCSAGLTVVAMIVDLA